MNHSYSALCLVIWFHVTVLRESINVPVFYLYESYLFLSIPSGSEDGALSEWSLSATFAISALAGH